MQQRRDARLRREYLYRKSLEGKDKERYEKKRKIRKALAEGKPIPTELRGEDAELRKEAELEDVKTGTASNPEDDEYSNAKSKEPKVLVCTSRDPSSRLSQFAKEVTLIIPNSKKVNRGGQILSNLVRSSREAAYTDIVIVKEHRGKPDGIDICHLPYGPTMRLSVANCSMRHDMQPGELGSVPGHSPRVIVEGMRTQLGRRVTSIIAHLFPEPKGEASRVVTFARQAETDWVSFRHHQFSKRREDEKGKRRREGEEEVSLQEHGPRFDMRPYHISLGTIDMDSAPIEWSLKPYMRSSKKPRL